MTLLDELKEWRKEYNDTAPATWVDSGWMTSVSGRLDALIKKYDSSKQTITTDEDLKLTKKFRRFEKDVADNLEKY